MAGAPDTTFKFQFKILMLGDSSVGKTALVNRFVHDRFGMTFVSTIGIDYKYKTIRVFDKEGAHLVRLVLWDTAGQERFRTITRQYYRGAHAVVLVYDSTNRATFENIDNWLTSIEQSGAADSKLAIALVANKCDLPNQTVSTTEGEELAARSRARFFRTSAKQDINVGEIFTQLTKDIERRMRAKERPNVGSRPAPSEQILTLPQPISLSRSENPTKSMKDSSCCGSIFVESTGRRRKTRPYSYSSQFPPS